MGDLVEAALGGPVEQGALRWLVETSQGNVLYVRELVLGALESGSLTPSGGLWQMVARPPVSPSLADLVAQRMAGMAAGERAPVELLAIGEPLRLNEVASLTDYDGLVAAEALGVVVVDPAGDEVRLAHPLYGEAVRAAAAGAARPRAARARRRDAPAARAVHPRRRAPRRPPAARRRSGDPVRAAGRCRAGRQPGGRSAARRAARRSRAAPRAPGCPRPCCWPARTRCASASRRPRRRSPPSRPPSGPTSYGIDYLEQRAHVLFWGLDRRSEARALLDAARAWSPEAGWRRRLEPLRVAYAAMVDGFEGSVDTLTDVLSDPGLDAETRRMAERRLALALFFTGRTAEAHELAARLRPAVPLRGYSDALALGLWRLMGFETGATGPSSTPYMAQTLRDAVRANDHEAAGHAAFSLGYTRLLAGRYRDAGRWFAEAELHFEQEDTFGTLIHVRAMRVGVDYFAGDPDGAATARADACRARPAGRRFDPGALCRPRRGLGGAHRRHAAGAQRFLRDAAARSRTMPGFAAQLLYEALRAGAPAATVAAELAGARSRAATRGSCARTRRTRPRWRRATRGAARRRRRDGGDRGARLRRGGRRRRRPSAVRRGGPR